MMNRVATLILLCYDIQCFLLYAIFPALYQYLGYRITFSSFVLLLLYPYFINCKCSPRHKTVESMEDKEEITAKCDPQDIRHIDGVNVNEIIQEENKLKLENEELEIKSEFNEGDATEEFKENREEQLEKEVKENRCKRIKHLLEKSRRFATALNDQVKAVGMGSMRYKKSNYNKVKPSSSKVKRLENDVSSAVLSEKKVITENEDLKGSCQGDVVDFFEKTRLTPQGHTVSEYQPVLVEGGVMRDYQLEGLQWLTTLFANGVNGILADEMGLGKTLQVVSFICNLIEFGICGPFLIIAPLSTIGNWMGEFQKFAPGVPTLFYHGSKKQRKNLLPEIMKPVQVLDKKVQKVVITTYEVILNEKSSLSKIKWHYIIVDEGHRIKNHNSMLSRTLREFYSVGKLLVTGTPLQNDLSELWSLLNFIIPEVFNSLEVFQSWFDIQQFEMDGVKFMEENYNINIVSTLHQILMPFLLRREKKDVSLKLPPKKEILVYCPMTSLQKKLYEGTVDRSIELLLKPKRQREDCNVMEPLPKRACVLHRNIRSLKEKESQLVEAERYREKYCQEFENQSDFALNIIMRNPQMQLRKIVNHPYLIQFPLIPGTSQFKIDEDLVKNSGKLLVVDAMLSRLKDGGHKVIIFTNFTSMLDILEYHAELREYRYCRFDGNSKQEERQECIMLFNTDPGIFLFLSSIRAGGLGINLNGADTIIIYDSDWNPQINLQSQDRCHRIGQTRPVVVYKLCVRGTIDERIIERGNTKRRLEKIIIQKGKFTKGVKDFDFRSNLLDMKELKALWSSTDYDNVIHSNGFVFTDEELEALLDRSEMGGECAKTVVNEEKKIFKLIEN